MNSKRPEANLTGGQVQQILDKLLYDSVHLIQPHQLIDSTLVTILSSLILDRRRKLSSIDYDVSIDVLCNLVLKNSVDAFEDMRQLKLERNLYLKIINEFLDYVKESGYVKTYSRWLVKPTPKREKKLARIEKRVGIPRDSLFMVYQNVEDNLFHFNEFKESILSQFIKLAHKYASAQVRSSNKSLSYDDLFQNIIAAISKGIDKYDSTKGALTSYIKYWIINAQNQDNSHTDGLAYEISYTQRQKVARKESSEYNYATSLSDAEHTLADNNTPEKITEARDSRIKLLSLIKYADPTGVFRLANSIEEHIGQEEIEAMRRHMASEVKAKLANQNSL